MKLQPLPAPPVRHTTSELGSIPVLWDGDVVVIGGGSAGSAAAVAAARAGVSVLLIESGRFLGGTGARVLDTFYGFFAPGDDAERVVGGIAWEVCTELLKRDMAFLRPNTYGAGQGVTYEPEALKVVWEELVVDAGADLLLGALLTAAIVDDGVVTGAVVATQAGPYAVSGSVLIDATGDGELAWRAGAGVELNTDVQPATATFRMGGVAEQPASTATLHELLREARASGLYDLPRAEGSIHPTVLAGVRHANMTRVTGYDTTDPWQLTAAELEGRRQVGEYVRFLRERVPGFADAFLVQTSSRLGIRESRRLLGEYVLTRDDVIGAREFDDAIARCGAPIEDHMAGEGTRWEYVGGSDAPTARTYGIPYRSLVPVEVEALLVAGRCLSATHDAHASVRSMGQCMAMGHAAGAAAAQAVGTGVPPRRVDVSGLRRRLRSDGAIL